MTDIASSFQVAVNERNYSKSSQLIHQVLKEGMLPQLVSGLREIEEKATHITLEQRDHIFYYLGLWDVYYAIQVPSIDVLDLLHRHDVQNNAPQFITDFIRDLVDKKDNRFDQFCVNIQTISRGHFAVLVPSILEQRTEELLHCKIQFIEGPHRLYSTADLLKTYYGQKIVAATHGHRAFDIVVSEDQYGTISESLASTGLDTDSMLEEIESEKWDEYVKSKRSPRIQQQLRDDKVTRFDGASELIVLHRVKSARSNIYSNNFNQQHTALTAIIDARTQLCNDILSDIATDSSHSLRNRALKQLGESGDLQTLELLDEIMKSDELVSIRREAARAYSTLVSKTAGLKLISPITTTKPPVVDISKINKILNELITKGMPTTMIDETISYVALQGGPESSEILLRLFGRPQEVIRQAIVKATRLLDKQNAAMIIREALNDESPLIVSLAENEINARWSDEVWD
ncbi:MAG: HEAT repeat domain-containing protein [Candidatus Thorarchaeota archaeon]